MRILPPDTQRPPYIYRISNGFSVSNFFADHAAIQDDLIQIEFTHTRHCEHAEALAKACAAIQDTQELLLSSGSPRTPSLKLRHARDDGE